MKIQKNIPSVVSPRPKTPEMGEQVMEKGGVNGRSRVMVAIDESDNSHYALMWVLENLKESVKKSPLVIFMAQPPPASNLACATPLGSANMYCSLSAVPEFTFAVQENHRKFTLALLKKAKEICASQGVEAETVTELGDPQDAIRNLVQKLNVNLLVLGQHELGKFERLDFPWKYEQLLRPKRQVSCSCCEEAIIKQYYYRVSSAAN